MSVSFHRILFPTDFSKPADHAQTYACGLADLFGAELHALHVVSNPQPVPGLMGTWPNVEEALYHFTHQAKLELAVRMESALTEERRVIQTVNVGPVVSEIIQYAAEHNIDLIVIGTHGHTGLSHLLLGSTAEKLVRLAQCPVLTVHPKDHTFTMDASAAIGSQSGKNSQPSKQSSQQTS